MNTVFINNQIILTILFVIYTSIGFCQKSSVYFKSNDYSLNNNAIRIIDSLSRISNLEKIYIQGYCDSIGSIAFNDTLSMKRANEVRTRFITNGVIDKLLVIKGLGERVSFDKNVTEKQRALNRRVDIQIVIQSQKTLTKDDTLVTESKLPIKSDEVEVIINGIVLNEQKQPLCSEIFLSDKKGNEIQTTKSGNDGKYILKTILKKNEDYSLTYYNDSSFISSKIINASSQRKPYKNLKTILPKLKEGNKYVIENFNFEGDTSQLVAASIPSLEALYKLMKKNRSLVIQIEGHVNYPNNWPNPRLHKHESIRYVPPSMNSFEFNQWLSDERAKMVYNYLVSKGIKEKRISAIGYGATKMLYPNAKTENEMMKNRRVEINVISYKKRPVE